MSFTRVTVIDCGASRTAIGVLSRKGSRLRLEDFAAEIFPVTAGNEETWLEHTRAALARLRDRTKRSGPVVVVLPAHLALAKLLKTPRVEPAKRAKIIRFEAEQNIPYALTDVVWDSVVVGERDIDLEVLLAVAKLDAVEPLCAAVQAAGFEPRHILPSALATLAGFRLAYPTQPEAALVLNLGARSTTLVLAEADRFVMRSLPLGGNSITLQLAGNQDCDVDEAEAIKLAERSANLTADAMETLATRLAQEITRSVLHFRRQSDLGNPTRLHLTGGGARLAGLAEALSNRLKVPVDYLDVMAGVEVAEGAARNHVADHGLLLADLIGAASTQLWAGQPVLNLLPPRRRSHENLRRRQPWLVAAAALAVAALVPPILLARSLAAEARHKTAAIEQQLGPLRERDARNRANLEQLAALRQEAAELQAVYARRTAWLDLLADVQERLGRVEDVWLERLQVVPATASAPEKLVISGRMLDQANPLSKVSAETTSRVKAFLGDINHSPFIQVAEEGQRFDNTQPGILKFDFVLVAGPAHPL